MEERYQKEKAAYENQQKKVCGKCCKKKKPIVPEKLPKRLNCCFKEECYDNKELLWTKNNLILPLCQDHATELLNLQRKKAAEYMYYLVDRDTKEHWLKRTPFQQDDHRKKEK